MVSNCWGEDMVCGMEVIWMKCLLNMIYILILFIYGFFLFVDVDIVYIVCIL